MANKSGNEIERRWLLKSVPMVINTKLSEYESNLIKQWYITKSPVIRLRSIDDVKYELTIKTQSENKKKDSIGTPEENIPLSEIEFYNLLQLATTKSIIKRRYEIPIYKEKIAELDVFLGDHKGLIIIEVEFKTESERKKFAPPAWFGKNEITGKKEYSNSSLAIDL